MNHTLQVSDNINYSDGKKFRPGSVPSFKMDNNGNLRGEVEIRDQFGRLLLKKKNVILAAGSGFTLRKLFNLAEDDSNRITLNSLLGINAGLGPDTPDDGPLKEKMVCLFAVGTGGAGLTFGDVKPAANREHNLFNIVPMRYVSADDDLTGDELETYFMRKEIGTNVAYYCKAFESTPTLVQRNADGTTFIPTTTDNDSPTLSGETYITKSAVETYVEINLQISENDVREYFDASDEGLALARVNELALYFGVRSDTATSTNGHMDYYQVEAFSKLTFNSEPFDDLTKILDIIYRIYC